MKQIFCILTLVILTTASSLFGGERPNILWLSCEDIGPHLGCYGDHRARTPNLDRLATRGVLYENAFVCAPVCAPCRSSIITGVYPTTLGTHHMRSRVQLPPEIKCFPEYLRAAGYYCTNNAKTDYQFHPPKTAWDVSSRRAHWKNRPDTDQPFFAVFNFEGTHESRVRGDQPAYHEAIQSLSQDEFHDPASLELPPYYPDTPAVRMDWARYYNCITAMDRWIALRLEELEDAGLADDTIIFFWGDHGVGLPRGKRWLYDSGLRVPLIVSIPEKFRGAGQGTPNSRAEELISLIDLPPTVLNLAGVQIPEYMQGRAFLGKNLSEPRSYILASRDRMDERYDMIRAIRDQQYKYILNFEPWKPYAQWISYGERCATMQELRRLHAAGELEPEAERFLAQEKPVEELYDLKADPHELKNLADSPEYAELKKRLMHALISQMQANRDLGVIPESELDERTGTQTSRYALFQNQSSQIARLIDLACMPSRVGIPATSATGGIDAHSLAISKLNDPDPTVRFWSIMILGRLAEKNASLRPDAVPSILAATQDASATVRVTAAEWLCRIGVPEKGLPILILELDNENRWIRLRAVHAMDLLGEAARPAMDALKKAMQRSLDEAKQDERDKYVARVANHALNGLLGTQDVVP
ncbi:MAG: sulfatase-like hydrolase/transferase [Pirellulales bacterium]|nr:sulfatase-like hydrolase/transferase [Pirellulales bacterium]